VISPATRFSAPAPTAVSHYESPSSSLSLSVLWNCCFESRYPWNGIGAARKPSIYYRFMYVNFGRTLDLLFICTRRNCETEIVVYQLGQELTDNPVRVPFALHGIRLTHYFSLTR
jgi:hypothetical protein